MARGYGRSKTPGMVNNMAKIGGSSAKLRLAGDMRPENMKPHFRAARKSVHKKV